MWFSTLLSSVTLLQSFSYLANAQDGAPGNRGAIHDSMGCYVSTDYTGEGFYARFYNYTNGRGYDQDFVEYEYSEYGQLVATANNVKDIDILFPAIESGIVWGDIYGDNLTVSNFTLILTGYFYAEQTGYYNFDFKTTDDAVVLYFASNAAFDCCASTTLLLMPISVMLSFILLVLLLMMVLITTPQDKLILKVVTITQPESTTLTWSIMLTWIWLSLIQMVPMLPLLVILFTSSMKRTQHVLPSTRLLQLPLLPPLLFGLVLTPPLTPLPCPTQVLQLKL